MVFKDQRGFAMLLSFQNSIVYVCFCFHAHRINTDLKIEQHSKTTLILKNQLSSNFTVNDSRDHNPACGAAQMALQIYELPFVNVVEPVEMVNPRHV